MLKKKKKNEKAPKQKAVYKLALRVFPKWKRSGTLSVLPAHVLMAPALHSRGVILGGSACL